MPFDAIVHAPELRPGARLNIAEADQVEVRQPAALQIGAEVRLRIGVCAPARSFGRIVGYTAHPECAVLAVGDGTWTLRRGHGGGVAVPGLLSETWYVVASSDAPSPADHSLDHSTDRGATEG